MTGQQKWLSVIGIGEEGQAGLSAAARSLLEQAQILVGGRRHLGFLDESDRRERLLWGAPLQTTIDAILQRRGQRVCVLATGDPMWYGIGATLARQVPLAEMTILPAPSAFSLACSRLGWSLTEVDTLSLCGRPPALLLGYLYPGVRLLLLSGDRRTPAIVAQLLTENGFGESQMTVLERMGSPEERQIRGMAATWNDEDLADLNTIAIDCFGENQQHRCVPGFPDEAYFHDGQLTKREIRSVTLSSLAPQPGQRLWDVGAGCGSISIEWLRSDRRCRAIAIEPHPQRLQYLADNAASLGVPHLEIIAGQAPEALSNLPQPHCIFIGGGLTTPDMLETCWQALPQGGRLVVNAVTVESEQKLFQAQQTWGGALTRIAIQRAQPLGRFLSWKAMAPVTQWSVIKA
ncbi:MAG: precorrin-6y C5,15-methyltransferase (decarboxylating) subunit CbiE [Phormidium sp. BM_Day4_Bin.17]|nr:precorrin-6y C5,15-methyltransferase (decarboxylating) subunit CbiE [Phormidium sp. BM_Day4_Bin.17]UCJ13432.1 MAG: precorrin-6y C5,15-methyltransferase (decarboxylating) subunit CbiE [Phormidium sp. PBR-2020]